MRKDELLKLLNSMDEPQEEKLPNVHERVMLIDGLNLFFRNFAMMNFVNSAGVHIGGLGGFIRSLNSLINQIKPTSVYVVFDGLGSSNNRKNLLPEYKSGRHQTRITNWDSFESLEDEHDAKVDQIVRLIHYLKCLPVKTLSIDKVEADDVIAYLSDILSNNYDSQVFIVSNDRDFVQLVDDKVILYRPGDKEYYTKNMVKQKFGVLTENFILYKTLLGDASDKVAGVKGLGEKGLLKKFPELAERPLTFKDIIEISAAKHKEHVVYSRVVFDMERLENNFRIMDLGNPLIDDNDRAYLQEVVEEPNPTLNPEGFMLLYNEDGIGHMIKNPEYTIKDTYKVLNSFRK
jgi:5'-3' exonuclease